MQLTILRQLATRSALLLTLGLGLGACDKAINVEPQNNISSDKGYSTKEDAAAGLLGCYDGLQGLQNSTSSYYGASFPSDVDMVSNNIIEVGTYNTTYGLIAQNQISADNVEIGSLWQSMYDVINRCNYLLEESDKITDPAFPKLTTQGEARVIRAVTYMNLLGLWGGTTQGYGYPGGVGVPLRLNPTLAIGDQTAALTRSSEADVATAIRADLDFAVTNLGNGTGFRVTKNAALALRARFELRMRNYADALKYAQQVPAPAIAFVTAALTATTTPDAIWQLYFSATDNNLYAFYWYLAPGGRNEFDPSPSLVAAHPAGDLRLPINSTSVGTTLKYTHTTTRDDYFNVVRYAEVVLTTAEAAAQTGDVVTATQQVNVIRKRAGLAPTTATTAAALITDILLQRRLELAYEGHYWFDLRRTNTVQSALGSTTTANAYNQTFRNLFPLPQRDVNLANGVLVQNTGY